MRRPLFRALLTGALGIGLVGGSAVTGGAASVLGASASAATCLPVYAIAFRGSGDAFGADGLANSTGGEGPVLQRIFTRARQLTYKDGGSFANVGIYGVDYNAVSSTDPVNFSLHLSDSVQSGVTLGGQAINYVHATCPSAKIILAGYSQGALVIRRLAIAYPTLVKGAFGVADGEQYPNAPGNFGPAIGGTGLARYIPGWAGATDGYYHLGIALVSYCDSRDPICDSASFFNGTSDNAIHGNYGIAEPERTTIANLATNVARVAAGLPFTSNQ